MNGSFGDRVGNHFAAAIVVALGLLFLLSSCSSDPADIELGDGDLQVVESSDLPGIWAWVRSTGGIAGATHTPATEGYEVSLRFFENGMVEYRVDGELDRSTTWVLHSIMSGPTHGQKEVRYGDPIFGWDTQFVWMSEDGHLILIDPCCDGFEHEYVRDGA